jgi:hypothetical protein
MNSRSRSRRSPPNSGSDWIHFWGRLAAEARSARCARYDLPLIFMMFAPSTIRSRNAMASGGSPGHSHHFSKSMFVIKAVDLSSRTLISLYNMLAAWGGSNRSTRSKPNSSSRGKFGVSLHAATNRGTQIR